MWREVNTAGINRSYLEASRAFAPTNAPADTTTLFGLKKLGVRVAVLCDADS